jgi:hypothetical protein
MAGDTDMAEPEAPVVDHRDRDDDAPPAAVAGLASNPTLAMLGALQSGGSDPGKALFGALAGQAGGPNVDLLMKLFGNDEASLERQREELREEIRAEQAEAIAALGDTAKRLFDEREQARARVESLAAALGACPVCFGENVVCETCHGAGVPGGRAPDRVEFNRYIVPAVTRVREALRRAAVRRPWQPQPSPSSSSTTGAM